jgi:hypothetical protein
MILQGFREGSFRLLDASGILIVARVTRLEGLDYQTGQPPTLRRLFGGCAALIRPTRSRAIDSLNPFPVFGAASPGKLLNARWWRTGLQRLFLGVAAAGALQAEARI